MITQKARWFTQLNRCYQRGYQDQQAGVSRDASPYEHGRNAGGSVQIQRRKAWIRGWDRAKDGKPLDDSNG